MRILADENFPGMAVEELRRRGHDVIWVGTVNPGLGDRDILAWAQDEQRLLVTLDKDFGELAFGTDLPACCGVVLFRIKMSDARTGSMKIAEVLESRSDWPTHFSVVEDDRIRMRPLSATYRTRLIPNN